MKPQTKSQKMYDSLEVAVVAALVILIGLVVRVIYLLLTDPII